MCMHLWGFHFVQRLCAFVICSVYVCVQCTLHIPYIYFFLHSEWWKRQLNGQHQKMKRLREEEYGNTSVCTRKKESAHIIAKRINLKWGRHTKNLLTFTWQRTTTLLLYCVRWLHLNEKKTHGFIDLYVRMCMRMPNSIIGSHCIKLSINFQWFIDSLIHCVILMDLMSLKLLLFRKISEYKMRASAEKKIEKKRDKVYKNNQHCGTFIKFNI